MNPPPKNPPSPAPTQRGWRIERIPSKPVRWREDERLALPLWLVRQGEHVADLELLMSVVEAEQLHAALCYALADRTAPSDAPDCRLDARQRARRHG